MKSVELAEKRSAEDRRFAETWAAELEGLRTDIEAPAGATLEQLRETIDGAERPLSALCLSGGGIRSASFALGMLQTLARYGMLDKFDYLSTVSGGGYIGSFLTAWRHSAGDAAVAEGLDRSRHRTGAEAVEIGGLRANSNYLTPKLGVLSADIWAALALIIRNLVLNWAIFAPFFMGVLAIPWVCRDILRSLATTQGAPAWPLLLASGVALCVGLTFASYGRRRAQGGWLTDGRFVLTVVAPIVVAATGFTACAALPAIALDDRIPWGGPVAGGGCYALAWLLASLCRPGAHAPAGRPRSESPTLDLLAWTVAGAITGLVLTKGFALAASVSPEWQATLGVSWTMLTVFLGELVYVGLRSYDARGDEDREWLARASGWLSAAAVTWSVTAAVTLFGPDALYTAAKWVIASVGGVAGLTTLILGGGAETAATTAKTIVGRLTLTQITTLAGVIFAAFLAIVLSWLDIRVSGLLAPLASILSWFAFPAIRDFVEAGALILISIGVSWFINVNSFSLHALYRNRLARAFLGSARLSAKPKRAPDPFTGFDFADNPPMASLPRNRLMQVVNASLNLVSTDNLAWQERKAEAFTFTPLHAGNPHVGYRPVGHFGSRHGGVKLGTAMAISGAAVSPNMGYHSSPLMGFLLMLFNLRLGCWLGNPAGEDYDRAGPRFGLFTMLQELAGMTTEDGRWIYLSDGGHFDNLGLYEMVRRRCRYIVISDAGCDPDATLADLGDAVRKASIDFGVTIQFDALKVQSCARPPLAGPYCWVGGILYPGSDEAGWILYIRPAYLGDEEPDIRAYAEANPTFPHEATTEQWFGESQFEAYRALGAHEMELICGAGADFTRAHPAPLDLNEFRTRAETYVRQGH
jgi:hypothetical protein